MRSTRPGPATWPSRERHIRSPSAAEADGHLDRHAGFQSCMSRNSCATTRVSSPTVKAGSPRAWRISAECQNCSWLARHSATEVNPSPSPSAWSRSTSARRITRTVVVSITATGFPRNRPQPGAARGPAAARSRLVVRDQPGRRGLLTRQDRGDELIAQRSREGELRDWQIVRGHGGKPTDPRSLDIRRLPALSAAE